MIGTSNSEGRKRYEVEAARRKRIESFAVLIERRREVTALALNDVYSGAGYAEADALLAALDDRGASIVVGDVS